MPVFGRKMLKMPGFWSEKVYVNIIYTLQSEIISVYILEYFIYIYNCKHRLCGLQLLSCNTLKH